MDYQCFECQVKIYENELAHVVNGEIVCAECYHSLTGNNKQINELENHRMKRQQDREHKIILKTFELINRIDWDIMSFEYDKHYLLNNLKERIKMIEEDLEETGEC